MTERRANGGYVYRARVPAEAHGAALGAWLARAWPHSDAATWEARIAAGELAVDGVAPTGASLRRGQEVTWARPPWTEPEVPLTFSVIHRDADLLVVAKPAGLPTAPAGGFLAHTLLALVRGTDPEATPMHRLGRGTSGLVLFALTPEARSALHKAFRERAVEKTYRARVVGAPPAAFSVAAPIGLVPHPVLGEIWAAHPAGKPSQSHFTRVSAGPTSLVDARIDTGRPHQIRIHAAWAGHPLVGDPLYGTGGVPKSDALPGETGYHLHAWRLAFAHPRGGEARFEAPLPDDLTSP